ncbi:PAS domain-containing sensor histidine kinase [Solirubrum puertoriconensis]|uniref:histidine kinase n=1 Tax=Solirubrum puertoriconensis TaxID=1751427 RepID=A0A9X0HMJ9_SOLP1|nr:PAS domain-containing protein [Solirubrum puertoriconensis]KUG08709.1 hypothetical protein ASU33_11245 [Solirubrum puertoriconensis]
MSFSAVQATQPADLPTWLPYDELLCEVLNVSMTGLIFYLPIYDPAGSGTIVDFTFVYLNPTAQRMMRMPARPTLTHMEQWPHSKEHGTFDFHVDAYLTGEPRSYNINYQADGYDNYYRLTARRAGEGLLVSFTDTADQPRSPVEIALRESQAREQAARAEIEAQRQQLQGIFNQAPVAIALLDGPEYRIALANPSVCEIWARPQAQVVGLPLFDALPEVRGQGLEELLEGVLRTGQPYVGTELPIQLLRHGSLETVYFNFVYQPQYNQGGETVGILVVATDVTSQVLARQQVQELNQELEGKVQERTQAALALQADLLAAAQRQVQQRETFFQIFEQTPASIALLRGPEHRFEYVNAAYQQLFPGRQLVGLPLAEALPETAAQGFVAWMNNVYQTGETFFGNEVLLTVEQLDGGPAKDVYFTFTYQAYQENGVTVGISIFAYDVTEQVLAKRQREAQQAQLAELFEQAPVAIVVMQGPEHRIEVVNPPAAQIWGHTQEEVLGKPLLEALPEVRDQGFKELLDRVAATGEAFVAQEVTAVLPRDGEMKTVYLNFVYQPLRDLQGLVNGVAAVAVDVSEQVAARRRVERNEQELRTLTDAIDQLVWTASPAGELEFFNAQWYRYTGSSWEQSRGTGWTLYYHPSDLPLLQQLWKESQQNGTAYHLEARLRDAEGTYRWFLIRAQPLRDASGRILRWFGTNTDIDERRHQEQELARAGELVRATLDSSADMIQVLDAVRDANGRIIDFRWRLLNAVATSSLGGDMVGRRLCEYHPGVKESGVFERFVQVMETGEPQRYELEYRHEQFNGWFEQSAVRLGDGLVTITADITVRKQAEQHLQATNEQLRRTNIDLDNFIYTASHDLKAPITNIEGLLYLLRDELPVEALRNEYVEVTLTRMMESVERFKRTIENLTDVSKLQKEHSQAATAVQLAPVVEEVRLDLGPLLQESRARLQIDVAGVPAVLISEKNLRSVVFNLLSNALKYRAPEREPDIRVRARVQDEFTVLEVTDNGLGIDPAFQSKLFTMFQRFHDHVEGTGVGLFMVKRIVENAGGQINVRSQLGAGTTFTVSLPNMPGPTA